MPVIPAAHLLGYGAKTVVCDTWRGTVDTWVAFRDSYNTIWLAERHGFITPETLRQTQLLANAKAA
jgi:hypothetical protein